MEIAAIFIIALMIDIVFGELPNSFHPVAWLGKLISVESRRTPRHGKWPQLVYGTIMVIFTIAVITLAFYFFLAYLKSVNVILYIVVSAVILKFTFSLYGLRNEANLVKMLVAGNKLPEARRRITALVSRDTGELDRDELISAIIESVAENSCDSFIAPLFYFLLFGIPGAIAYRIINTFDAMIGYHGNWEYTGKFAARLDDVANFIPARITAVAIVLAAWLGKRNPARAWRIMFRDHNKTESPNAGWTMSALAGALGVQLEKRGSYRLGDNTNTVSIDSIRDSLRLIVIVALIWSFIFLIVQAVYFVAA
jgi:adenosylcobinamide-phosphate synthase